MLRLQEEEILDLLDNDGKILYILKNYGPLRFEEIVSLLNPYEKINNAIKKSYGKSAGDDFNYRKGLGKKRVTLSRGTISKHLKYLKSPEKNFITQISEMDPQTGRNYQKYDLTVRGRAYIGQIIRDEENIIDPKLFGLLYTQISEFFKSRGLDSDLHLPRIINMIARINQAEFFRLPQTEEFFYMLFYIYQNSLEFSIKADHIYYMDINFFAETYSVSKIQIQAQLEKFLDLDMGYFRIKWQNRDLFFHKDDLFGSLLTSMARNALEAEIIKRALKVGQYQNLEQIAVEITTYLLSLNFIRKNIESSIKKFILAYLILMGQERGLNKVDLFRFYPPLNLLNNDKKGVDFIKSIFFDVRNPSLSRHKQLEAIERGLDYIRILQKEA